jgi:adenylylsulfate kinase
MPDSTGWAVWFVGLPGSGKSALARGVRAHLEERGYDPVSMQMDGLRKKYVPEPKYTPEERDFAYAAFVDEAADHVRQGRVVLMDGAAYKRSMRAYARQRIARFAEVHVNCDLEEAMRREAGRPEGLVMADLYAKALRRRRTGEQFEGLGEVIGVDVEFEADPEAEFFIDNTHLPKEETLRKTLHFLDTWLGSD